jgi:cytochrome b involved in lipid metabolism
MSTSQQEFDEIWLLLTKEEKERMFYEAYPMLSKEEQRCILVNMIRDTVYDMYRASREHPGNCTLH